MIQGYTCKFCNTYNDILTNPCWYCKELQVAVIAIDISLESLRRTGEFYPMTEDRVELHAKFFNGSVVLCEQMTDEQLESYIKELSNICFQGRAQLNGAEHVKRKRNALLSPKSREWLVSADQSEAVSDALNQIKERKSRMSKADKLKEAMVSLGLADADVSSLIGKVEKTARTENIGSITYKKTNRTVISELCRLESHETCTGSFHSDGKSNQCTCKCHTTKSKWNEEESTSDKGIEDLFK